MWKLSPELAGDFLNFKKMLLDLRGFRNKYEVTV